MNCHFAPLAQEALLHITGPDTLKFLQGQVTCDTRKIDAGNALPGAFCTPQGRVVCDFLLFGIGPEHYALRMRRDIRAASSAAFGKYIIFSKAKLDASNEDWIPVALWGEDAASAVRELVGEAPAGLFGVSRSEGAIAIQTDAHGRQFECFLNATVSAALLAQLAERAHASTEAQWQAMQITAGIARIETATALEYVPQNLNYDLTGHISFKKGCYTGQEVVARLHYRGKPKRRCYLATSIAAADCPAGTALFAADSGQNIGNVVNWAATADGAVALVSTTAASAASGLLLGDANGPPLVLGQLPYTLETE